MKKNKLPNLVTVAVLTLITSVMWASFNIYRSLTAKPSPAVPPSISNPINPILDLQTLGQINSKIFVDESQIPEVAPVNTTPTPLPNTVIPPTASSGATPITLPELSTESGETF